MSTDDFESFVSLMERQEYSQRAPTGAVPEEGAAYLLSPERAQRFELLMLLIANLGKPLALCGADGIGKSTFLGLLAERALDGWHVVSLRGDGVASQGDIMSRIARHAALSAASQSAVADYLRQLARNRQALVLLLDDAGNFAPGVLSGLGQFARDYPALRLVLALRPDEARLKSATDVSLLGECHFVDIPALTLSQCEAYLQRLAQRPPRLLSPEDVTPMRVCGLHRASQGVPGRIVQLLAGAPAAAGIQRSYLMLAVAALGGAALAAALVTGWYRESTVLPDAVPNPPESPVTQMDAPPLSLPVADRQPAAPSATGEAVPANGARERAPPAPPAGFPPAEQVPPLAAPLPAPSSTPAQDATVVAPQPPEPAAPAKADVAPPPSSVGSAEQPSSPSQSPTPENPQANATAAPSPVVPAPPSAPATVAAPTEDATLPAVDKSLRWRVADTGSVAKKAETKMSHALPAEANKASNGAKAGDGRPARPVQVPIPSRWTARVVEPQEQPDPALRPPLPPAPPSLPTPIPPQPPAMATPIRTPAPSEERVGPPAVLGEPPVGQAPLPAPVPMPATVEVVPRSDATSPTSAPAIPAAPKDEVSVISQLWQSVTGGEPEAPPLPVRSQPQAPLAPALPAALTAASGTAAAGVAPPMPPAPAPEAAPLTPATPPAAEGPTAAASSGPGLTGLRDPGWLLSQAPQSYTLRVMSAREVASIRALLQRYPALRGQLVAFKTLHGASEWYPVYYGVFATEAEAWRAAAQLPAALGKPVPRQLKLVQQEIRAAQR